MRMVFAHADDGRAALVGENVQEILDHRFTHIDGSSALERVHIDAHQFLPSEYVAAGGTAATRGVFLLHRDDLHWQQGPFEDVYTCALVQEFDTASP